MDQVYIGTTTYGSHWLDRPAAESWFRMVRDGCPAAGITDAGRTQREQVTVFLRYFTTNYAASARFDQRYWNGQNYWRRPGQPSAATPGSVQARHTFGRALDLNGSSKSWVRANGHRYGWIKDLVGGEDWHMEYQPARDVAPVSNPGASTGTVPTIPTIPTLDPLAPEDDMPYTPEEIEHFVENATARALAGNLDRLVAESLSKNLGNLGGGPAKWFKDSVDFIVAETLGKNLGTIAGGPAQWFKDSIGAIVREELAKAPATSGGVNAEQVRTVVKDVLNGGQF